MELLVKQLAIPLSNQKTVAKWLVIAIPLVKLLAIPLGCPKTATKWLVMSGHPSERVADEKRVSGHPNERPSVRRPFYCGAIEHSINHYTVHPEVSKRETLCQPWASIHPLWFNTSP